jgi:hypothetical protein
MFLSLLPRVVPPAPSPPPALPPTLLPLLERSKESQVTALLNHIKPMSTSVIRPRKARHLIPHAHAAMICTIHESCYMTTEPTSPLNPRPRPRTLAFGLGQGPCSDLDSSCQSSKGRSSSSIRSVPRLGPFLSIFTLCCTC